MAQPSGSRASAGNRTQQMCQQAAIHCAVLRHAHARSGEHQAADVFDNKMLACTECPCNLAGNSMAVARALWAKTPNPRRLRIVIQRIRIAPRRFGQSPVAAYTRRRFMSVVSSVCSCSARPPAHLLPLSFRDTHSWPLDSKAARATMIGATCALCPIKIRLYTVLAALRARRHVD